MSRNYYFVVTYNVRHPTVMGLLDRIKMKQLDKSMVDFKIRSKLYMKFEEVVDAVNEDFESKLEMLYPKKTSKQRHEKIKLITIANPLKMMQDNPEALAAIIEKFGHTAGGWDEDCEITFFFTEDEYEDEDVPSTWMFKFEVYHIDDEISLSLKNGERIFRNIATAGVTSTYH